MRTYASPYTSRTPPARALVAEPSSRVVVCLLLAVAGACCGLMAIVAWHSGAVAMQWPSVGFGVAYVGLAQLLRRLKTWRVGEFIGLGTLSLHCLYVAFASGVAPAPAYALLPSLMIWLLVYNDRRLLRVVCTVHILAAVACGLASAPAVGDGSLWLSYVVLAFCTVALLIAANATARFNRLYYIQMREFEDELQSSERSLQASTQRQEAQRDALARTAAELRVASDSNARQIADLRFVNEERAQIAQAASSDLKQPLRNITSFVQLIGRRLERDGLADAVREYLGFVVDGAARMNAMVDDLLRYSADPESTEPVCVETSATLEAIGDNLRDLLAREGATLGVAPGLPPVLGHPTQVLQLFQNLISNGVKFRDPGRAPVCRITHERVGAMLRFGVHDNGIGIPANRLADVFGLFTRLHERGAYEGTGIGLATCRRIVIAHGGEIWAESTVGVGTSFYFTLPAGGARTEPSVGETLVRATE